MIQSPTKDGSFKLVSSTTPGAWDFRVARNESVLTPNSAIQAGTKYKNSGLTNKPRNTTAWDEYVAAQNESEAGSDYTWQYFVRSLPTTPAISERVDPMWGKVYDHTYLDLLANVRPDRAEMFTAGDTILTALAGGPVTDSDGVQVMLLGQFAILDVTEMDKGQGLCQVVVTTVTSAVVAATERVFDPESGRLLPVKTENILLTGTPTGHEIDSLGKYAEVAKVRHNHWLRTTRLASGLPPSRSQAVPFLTTGQILWPAVLQSYEFLRLSNDNAEGDFLLDFLDSSPYLKAYHHDQVLSYTMRDPFAGPVRVEERKWFQYAPPEVVIDAEMLPSSMRVAGRNLSFTVPECLHGAFEAKEYSFSVVRRIGGSPSNYNLWLFHQNVVWSFTRTEMDDWPATVTRFESKFQNGGYQCEERTYHRPLNYQTSRMTVTQEPATVQDWRLGL